MHDEGSIELLPLVAAAAVAAMIFVVVDTIADTVSTAYAKHRAHYYRKHRCPPGGGACSGLQYEHDPQ